MSPSPGPRGYPPSERGRAVLDRVRGFIADEALRMVEEVEREIGHGAPSVAAMVPHVGRAGPGAAGSGP